MEFFRTAKTVRLKNCHGYYLCAETGVDTSALHSESLERRAALDAETRRDWWSVEFVVNSDSDSDSDSGSDSVLRLKSSFGKYLDASDQLSFDMGGGKVVQSPPSLDSSLKWKPLMVGTQVKLRTHYGSFLNAKDNRHITHDISHRNTILWDVEVIVEREQEGSATNVDDRALEEGSATKRRHETGEGSSVAKNFPGDSGLIRESDEVVYRRHFWNLKIKLFEETGRTDVLVEGGSGTTALVREVCADVLEQFDTVVWIGIPQKIDSALITEEMLLQLTFERMAFPGHFNGNHWMLEDCEFSSEKKPRCLIVVDNLDDRRTQKKFEEILRKVKTCQVIFIARRKIDKLPSLYRRGHESDPHGFEVKDLPYVPREDDLRSFLEKTSTSPSKGVCRLIVNKCERLPTAIVFVLREDWLRTETIKGVWEATIPSGDCRRELDHLQRALKICNQKEEQALETNYDDEDRRVKKVLEILSKDDHRFCFLHLSILPPNSPISCQRVTRLWAAQRCLTNQQRAKRFFKYLLQEELIYPEERRRDGELSSFRVYKGVREIIASLSNLSNLVSTTSLGGTYWPEKVEYLSVQGTIGPLYEEKSFQLSRISALDVSIGEDRRTTFEASPLETSEIPSSSSSLKHSKVLDLTGAPFPVVPYKLFELTDVRCLSLRNTSISVIPRSIRKLRHLEFLDAKQSLVTKLPREAEGLQRLRHILIYHHEKDPLMESYNLIGFKALCRLGRFQCLEKLCFVEADEETLGDIGNLTKLMRLGITELRKEHSKLLCSSLQKLKRLESLNLHASDEDEIIDLHHLSRPPTSLKRLYLHCRLNKLPDWISKLVCLTKIVLRWSNLEAAIEEKEDLLATLGKLPELVQLELRRAYNGRRLDFKHGQFPKLKILLLDELGRLRSMSLAKGTMPSLEDLTISRCPWLEGMPTSIEDIRKLKALEFFDMSPEFYKSVLDDCRYSLLKPNVYFTQWRPGHWETTPLEGVDKRDEASQVNTESRLLRISE